MGEFGGGAPTEPSVIVTFPGPAAFSIERSTSRDSLSVASTLLPIGARKRNKSWPEETCGKISLPRNGHKRTMPSSAVAIYRATTIRRFRVNFSRILPKFSRNLARSEGAPFSSAGAWARRIHVERTGTSELDNRYEAAIANPTARESGIKRERETPTIKKDGTNTARTHSMARRRGIWTSLLASRTATARPCP